MQSAEITHLDMIRGGEGLREASFSRIFQHIDRGNGFMIASAYRTTDNSGQPVGDSTNIRNTKRLALFIRSEGFGFFYLDGRWEDQETGIVHPEVVIAVPGNGDSKAMQELAKASRRMFDQDAVLLVPPGDNKALLVNRSGSTSPLGTIRFDERGVAKVWSEVKFGSKQRGRPFTFEAAWWHRNYDRPNNMMDAWNKFAEATV